MPGCEQRKGATSARSAPSFCLVADLSVGVFLAGVTLLVIGGLAKLRDPSITVPALGALNLPDTTLTARALGTVEIFAATAAVLWPGRATALAVVTIYAALTIATARLARSGDVGCGCLGRSDSPATAVHVVMDAVFALSAVLVAFHTPASLRALMGGSIVRTVWLVALAVLMALLAQIAMSELPRAWGASSERRVP